MCVFNNKLLKLIFFALFVFVGMFFSIALGASITQCFWGNNDDGTIPGEPALSIMGAVFVIYHISAFWGMKKFVKNRYK